MSYDVHLGIETGLEAPDDWVTVWDIGNYTSNVSPMWDRALPPDGIAMLDGKKAGRVARALRFAVKRMERNRAEYEAMNPPNGWGSYAGALQYLGKLADACTALPHCTIRVSR